MIASWAREISPPPLRKQKTIEDDQGQTNERPSPRQNTSPAAIEAGRAVINDHLQYFCQEFEKLRRPTQDFPTVSIAEFKQLYQRNQHRHGRHFVVHQHDHPIAGVHYDLRLQISETSTVSFAIPYGLPGNASSSRPNRMAIETRVHNLWNNLIESASHTTGSLLIWDTGEYEVLPYRQVAEPAVTDDDMSGDEEFKKAAPLSENQRLFSAFQDKHIRLRLHGQRLPPGYTISLRLPRNNYQGRAKDPSRKRRRVEREVSRDSPLSSGSDSEQIATLEQEVTDAADASGDDEDATIRANNAYPGAINSIGSIHQRHWFLSLDKKNSTLAKPFFVMGRDIERSVVTGRSADDVLADEGVSRFIGRKMWRPVTE